MVLPIGRREVAEAPDAVCPFAVIERLAEPEFVFFQFPRANVFFDPCLFADVAVFTLSGRAAANSS